MSHATAEQRSAVLTRTRRRLEQEKVKCMQRYDVREQRVLKTLNYCMAALERLEGWAVFAIFPTDELQNNTDSSYSAFVEQRFRCVTDQLRGFEQAIKRRQRIPTPTPDVCTASLSRDLDLSIRSRSAPPTADSGPEGSLRMRVTSMSKRFVEEGRYIRQAVLEHLHRCRSDLHVVLQWGVTSLGTLSDVIDETMADELACMVREKMLRILSDVTDFEEAAEEFERTMSQGQHAAIAAGGNADESASGGKARSVAPRSEQTLNDNELQERLSDSGQEELSDDHAHTASSRLKDSGIVADRSPPPLSASAPVAQSFHNPALPPGPIATTADRFQQVSKTGGGAVGRSKTSSVVADNRVMSPSDDWLGFYLKHTPPNSSRSAGSSVAAGAGEDGGDEFNDVDGQMTYRSDGSTPEPPLSSRPPNLLNHPKILKDKLHQTMSLNGGSLRYSLDTASLTGGARFMNRSWTFAGHRNSQSIPDD